MKLNPGVPAWRGKRHRELRVTGRGGQHGRTMIFFNSAAVRLSWNDYEKVSVAMICREAHSTTDTFYKRFPSKPAFYYGLVLVAFREMTRNFNRAMDPKAWKDATPQAIIYRLVDEVIASTMTVPTLGVTQLAIRIAMSKSIGAKPYLEFRAAILDRAVELLSPKLKIRNSKESIRNSMQMVLAMATDEAWRHGIPFKTQQKSHFIETYSNLVFRCLELAPRRRNTKDIGAIHWEKLEFPEHLRIAYGISMQFLTEYERKVNSSEKPEFILDQPIEPVDAAILATRAEDRKTEKPVKRKRKPTYKMLG